MEYDLIVIGGGPAGYVGAIRATQLGKKVACIDIERAGGTCLNWGCIPTKALLKNAELFQTLQKQGKDFGIQVENLTHNWKSIIARSRKISNRLAGGIEFLFKKNKVDYLVGEATLLGDSKIKVRTAKGETQILKTDKILICTGCTPKELPNFAFNGKTVLSSKHAMSLDSQPKELIIIGAGAIGIEFAYIYNVFGTKVTIIEMQSHLLPVEDEEIGEALKKSFTKQGIRSLVNSKTKTLKDCGDYVEILVETPKGEETLKADSCLVAIGVQPRLPKGLKFELNRGFLKVDERYQTSLSEIYASGDIIGPPWLAHTASFEAIQCVEGMFVKGKIPKKVTHFPGCTYCHPQVASVGRTESDLKESGISYKVGRFPFQAIGKAQAIGATEGFVKLLFGKEHGEILGAHIIGENATEIIAEMGLAINLEATIDDIHSTIHAHPTLSEAIHEATLAAEGRAIHC